MNIKKLITDLQVCADDDIICPACDRYHEMKEKGGTADCVNKLLRDAAVALEKQQGRYSTEQQAIFRLGQMDMRDSMAAMLRDVAKRSRGTIRADFMAAADLVAEREIP